MQYFLGKGFNTFRVAFLMERVVPPPTGLTGGFNATYFSGLQTVCNLMLFAKVGLELQIREANYGILDCELHYK